MENSGTSDFSSNPLDANLVGAAERGDVDRIGEFARAGANVNAMSGDNTSALICALRAGRKDSMAALLTLGADPNLRLPAGVSPMTTAAKTADSDFLRMLIEHGGDPNSRSGDQKPLLHIAILAERWVNVELLVDHGADINAQNVRGFTPALLCAYLDDFAHVAYFLEMGADHTLAAENGTTLPHEVENCRLAPSSERGRWVQVVRKKLIERGVRFAPPPAEEGQ